MGTEGPCALTSLTVSSGGGCPPHPPPRHLLQLLMCKRNQTCPRQAVTSFLIPERKNGRSNSEKPGRAGHVSQGTQPSNRTRPGRHGPGTLPTPPGFLRDPPVILVTEAARRAPSPSNWHPGDFKTVYAEHESQPDAGSPGAWAVSSLLFGLINVLSFSS